MPQQQLQLCESNGRPISISKRIGGGAEGEVYEVRGNSDLVAKLYLKPVSSGKAAKLAVMPSLRTERLSRLAAWPIETLHDGHGGKLVGIMMPKVKNQLEIHELYGLKTRIKNFPAARWPFLIQAAVNLSKAFHVVHEHGHVIGDINHGSVMVSSQATVTLVDCDSFQINARGRYYLCEVANGTHTPPELQGKDLSAVLRTKEHDAFGLAVLIFQLLFIGRHPFVGRSLTQEQPTIEKAIHEYRFAYGKAASSRKMLPPPASLPLEALPSSLVTLFENAFLYGRNRPTAKEWIIALEGLMKNLATCRSHDGHQYWRELSDCPWCEIEVLARIEVFKRVKVLLGNSGFTLDLLWKTITELNPPQPPTWGRTILNFFSSPSAGAPIELPVTWMFICGIYLALIIVSLILSVSPLDPFSTLLGLSGACLLSVLLLTKYGASWRVTRLFYLKRSELEKKKQQYEGLDALRTNKLNELTKRSYELQLAKHLEGYRLETASIRGIGPSRKWTLQSYGIETANDISWQRVYRVPGFGPTLTSDLVDWRKRCESHFVFNPKISISQSDRDKVEFEIDLLRRTLQKDLQDGLTELQQLSRNPPPMLRKTVLIPALLISVTSLVSFTPLRKEYKSWLERQRVTQASYESASPTPSPSPTPREKSSDELKAEAQALYEQGSLQSKAGKYKDAVVSYQRALAIQPDNALVLQELGFALYQLKRYEEAQDTINRALSLEPERVESIRILGLLFMAKAKWKEAIDTFERALKIESNHPQSHYYLGLSYWRIANLTIAEEELQAAIKLKPDYALAHYDLGRLYIELDSEEQARQQYEVLLSQDSKLASKLYALFPTSPTTQSVGNDAERGAVMAEIRQYFNSQSIAANITASGTKLIVSYEFTQIEYAPDTFFRQQGRTGIQRIADAGFETLVIEAKDSKGELKRKEYSVVQYRTK